MRVEEYLGNGTKSDNCRLCHEKFKPGKSLWSFVFEKKDLAYRPGEEPLMHILCPICFRRGPKAAIQKYHEGIVRVHAKAKERVDRLEAIARDLQKVKGWPSPRKVKEKTKPLPDGERLTA